MSDIQGLGSTPPLRAALPATRSGPARPAAQPEALSAFGQDAVQVSLGVPTPSSPVPVAAPPEPRVPEAMAPAPRPRLEEVDGFFVAGSGQVPCGAGLGTPSIRNFEAGPIALLDEPGPAEAGFPELGLNGPSTAAEGLFTLGGFRLA